MKSPLLLAARTAATVAALSFAGCGDATPPADPRLLVVDDVEIRLDELDPYVAFLDSYLPEGGRKTKVQHVLEEHVLPLRLAQRAFGPQRAEQRARAEALCAVAGNVAELEQQSRLLPHQHRSTMSRRDARLPVAMFLFDPLRVGAVSPPIELPQGWFVAAAYDLRESPVVYGDMVDALQVGFVTHTAGEWASWYGAERERIATKVTYVHPDYRDAMPSWLQLPRQP